MDRYYFLVTSGTPLPASDPLLFIYETPENNEYGTYTAYCRNPEQQDYWRDWTERRYFKPAVFMTRFGYRDVRAGKIRDEAHLRALIDAVGNGDDFSGTDKAQ